MKEKAKGDRILVVDDNHDAAESLQVLLSLMGNEVAVAYSGKEAVEMAEASRPDVVFLDIGLPGMNGYDIARAIRRSHWGRNTTLIALTGWGLQDDRDRARDAGFDHHFVKPIAFEDLSDTLSRLPAREAS